jgi:hypothetical protein
VSRDTITPAQLRARGLAATARPTKYGSRRTYLAAIDRWFASQREANAAAELLIRQQQGEVRGLRFQARYSLDVNDEHVCDYICDFVYEERCPARDTSMGEAWVTVVADSKGFRTREYLIKKKLMRACHSIEIREM